MQLAPLGGQIWNHCKLCHLAANFVTYASGKIATNTISSTEINLNYSSWKIYSRSVLPLAMFKTPLAGWATESVRKQLPKQQGRWNWSEWHRRITVPTSAELYLNAFSQVSLYTKFDFEWEEIMFEKDKKSELSNILLCCVWENLHKEILQVRWMGLGFLSLLYHLDVL